GRARPGAARSAVERAAGGGARVIKVALAGEPRLDHASLRAAVAQAHARGLRVAAHALGREDASEAAEAGVDVLAHAPLERMSDDDASEWSGEAVITTLVAFGASAPALANIAKLRVTGATVLYGTDLGNVREVGIDARELEAMIDAGMEPRAILEAGTSAPAAFWGLSDLGELAPGKAASFLLCDEDPFLDPRTLAAPSSVFID